MNKHIINRIYIYMQYVYVQMPQTLSVILGAEGQSEQNFDPMPR